MANIYSNSVGVKITEYDQSLTTIHNSKTSCFYGGYFQRGACNSLVSVNSVREFIDTFGVKTSENINDWYQVYNYLQYAGNINVSRSVSSLSLNSCAEYPINKKIKPYLLYNLNDFENKYSIININLGNQLKFFAKDPGIWGNDISVMMINYQDFQSNVIVYGNNYAQSLFRDIPYGYTGVLVFYQNELKEMYVVNFQPGTSFIEKINYSSDYIFVKYNEPNGRIDGYYSIFDGSELVTDKEGNIILTFTFESTPDSFTIDDIDIIGGILTDLEPTSNSKIFNIILTPEVKYSYDLSIGINNDLPNCLLTSNIYFDGNKDIRTHPSFSDLPTDVTFSFYNENKLNFSQGISYFPEISDLQLSYDIAKNKEVEIDYIIANELIPNYIIDIANSRKDVITFVGAPQFFGDYTTKIANTVDYRLNTLGDSDYCFFVMNYKKIYNNDSNSFEYCNLAGDIAGLRVQTDTKYNRWTSSAGETRGIMLNGQLDFYPNRKTIDDMYLKGINSFIKDPNNGIILFGNRILTLISSSLDRLTTRNMLNYMSRELEKISRYTIFELADNFTKNKIENSINNFLQNVKNTKGLINFGTRITIDSANNKLIINIIYQPNYVADLIQINFINSGTNSFITIS